jgi:predicted ATPase
MFMSESERALAFTSIHLKNWRNFEEADVNLRKRLFIVGPNASGKSNFLDAFRFLHDIVIVGGGFQQAVRKRNGVSSLRNMSVSKNSTVEIGVSLGTDSSPDEWRLELSFTQDKSGSPIIGHERVIHGGTTLLARPDRNDKSDRARLTQTYLEQVQVNQEFRDIAEFFSTIRYLHIVPQLIREPERSKGLMDDPYGGDFVEQIGRLPEKARDARLHRIRDALRIAVPQLRDLEWQRDRTGTPHLRVKYENWASKDAWHTEEQFSDGTLRLMGLLWSALDGGGPLLLEEPELSLHSQVVRYIPQMLARLQRRSGRQVFMSTHSPDLLQDTGIGLNEVLLLLPTLEGTQVQYADSIQDAGELLANGLSLADVVIPNTTPKRLSQLTLFGE